MTIAATVADGLISEPSVSPAALSLQRLDRLDRLDLSAPSLDVAPALLGRYLVRDDGMGRQVGRIVETEAYAGPGDLASHARAGPTKRTAVMFGPPGQAYVYLVYGMHNCLNVVCSPDGEAGAVLIRAIEPIAGIEKMRSRRGHRSEPDERLGAGPARLCQALGIDRSFGGLDLVLDERLWLAETPVGNDGPLEMISGPRIGVAYAGPDWATRPWRFGIAGHRSLSRPFPTLR